MTLEERILELARQDRWQAVDDLLFIHFSLERLKVAAKVDVEEQLEHSDDPADVVSNIINNGPVELLNCLHLTDMVGRPKRND